MNLVLKRTQFRQDGIFGELLFEDGSQLCMTLEHSYADLSAGFSPKVPLGMYKCVRGTHRLEGARVPFETFEVMNVPGHTGILFHVGNFNNDSDGCILLGQNIEPDPRDDGTQIIFASQDTFNRFMQIQSGINQFLLTIVNYEFTGWKVV